LSVSTNPQIEYSRGPAASARRASVRGAISVAALGALLNARLQSVAGPGVDANATLDPILRARLDPASLHKLTGALSHGLQGTFLAIAGLSVVFLATALLFPRGSARSLVAREPESVAEG